MTRAVGGFHEVMAGSFLITWLNLMNSHETASDTVVNSITIPSLGCLRVDFSLVLFGISAMRLSINRN